MKRIKAAFLLPGQIVEAYEAVMEFEREFDALRKSLPIGAPLRFAHARMLTELRALARVARELRGK